MAGLHLRKAGAGSSKVPFLDHYASPGYFANCGNLVIMFSSVDGTTVFRSSGSRRNAQHSDQLQTLSGLNLSQCPGTFHLARTGIFIEKIYRRMSTSQLMVFPVPVLPLLHNVDQWNFDMFSFAQAANGSPLKYLGDQLFLQPSSCSGYHLLQQHGCLHKFKVPPSTLEVLLGRLEAGYTK